MVRPPIHKHISSLSYIYFSLFICSAFNIPQENGSHGSSIHLYFAPNINTFSHHLNTVKRPGAMHNVFGVRESMPPTSASTSTTTSTNRVFLTTAATVTATSVTATAASCGMSSATKTNMRPMRGDPSAAKTTVQ
ncbi:hypothetical protein Fmac_028064 [Flemingia macrophylla]|uniref:Uncharacterized protein n=1 Tax=Flemingia macrophylla TaxID=520843 RepID=A0ABD1LJI3_9FABA